MPPARPHISVTLNGPDDGGDFGPGTPGTRTSGIQEALDCAHAQCRDLHIWGGRGGLHQGTGLPDNVYTLDETLRVPWSQDFTLSGGNYLLSYRPEQGSALSIDSQMNCRYKFGLISSSAPDPVVAIRPETPGPDDFTVITASLFDFSAICSHHPEGTSLLIDSTHGPIVNSQILAEETNSQGTGVYMTDAGGRGYPIANNQLRIPYGNQYHGQHHCTGLRLGDPGSQKILHNRLELSFHAPRGAYFDADQQAYVTVDNFVPEGAIGAAIHAQRNWLSLSFYGPRAPGHDLVFEADARDNTVNALNLPNGYTNRARVPTNRIVPNWPVGYDLETPPVPPSEDAIINTHPYTAQILILTPGQVSSWTHTDAGSTAQNWPHNLSLVDNLRRAPSPPPAPRPPLSQTVKAGLTAGQMLTLEPGESLNLDYSAAPTWRWKALG